MPLSKAVRLAPRYVAVTPDLYARYRETVLRYHGTAETLDEAPNWGDGLAFYAGSRGAAPGPGDEVCLGRDGRLDAFKAGQRHFVLAES